MSRLSALWTAANEMVAELSSWIETRDKRKVFLRLSREDQIRLMRLRTWELRYYISVQTILDLVLPVLRATIKRKSRRWILGVSVSTLTGDAAERILQEQLNKLYPNGEHIRVWKERERDRQLEVERLMEDDGVMANGKTADLLTVGSVDDYVARYRIRIQNIRHERDVMTRKFGKKPYRWNPFL